MADVLTPELRRLNMSRVRGRDTKPEMIIRRGLHARGLRFRLHRRDLPGRPDIVLPSRKTVLFIHGCFWHGHDCPLFRMPATRPDFWRQKITANRLRDATAVTALGGLGWRVGVVWECALRGARRLSTEILLDRLVDFIAGSELLIEIRGER
ncbi:very short patch repair endonuclease [Sphingobium chlorophenolicum]|uniref:very short patch repair endonuclease n=1 Tax=Sphingobium chlorophenolicum TaxID=46429 RepID=UPI0009DE0AB4|nr:DNA mismatch endonuclease Vsr [Sphingobium chlorophenolicum]